MVVACPAAMGPPTAGQGQVPGAAQACYNVRFLPSLALHSAHRSVLVAGLSGLRVLCLGAHGLRRIVRRPGHVLHLRACQRNHHRPSPLLLLLGSLAWLAGDVSPVCWAA